MTARREQRATMSGAQQGVVLLLFVLALPATLFAALGLAWWGGDRGALGLLAALPVATIALFLHRTPAVCGLLLVTAASVGQIGLCWSYATEATRDNKYPDIVAAAAISDTFWLTGAAVAVAAFVAAVVAATDFVREPWRRVLGIAPGLVLAVALLAFWQLEALEVAPTSGAVAPAGDILSSLIVSVPLALYSVAGAVAGLAPTISEPEVTSRSFALHDAGRVLP